MVVDPEHRYSNESKRVNWDIYDGFKLKKNNLVGMFFLQIYSVLEGLMLDVDSGPGLIPAASKYSCVKYGDKSFFLI